MKDVKSLGMVYLATPYTKYQNGINHAFKDAATLAGKMVIAGYKVYSPITHTHPIAMFGGIDPYSEMWVVFDEAMMGVSDTLVVGMLPGWEDSWGVRQEIEYFKKHEKKIVGINPETMELVDVD